MSQSSQQGLLYKSFLFAIFFPGFKSQGMGHDEKKFHAAIFF